MMHAYACIMYACIQAHARITHTFMHMHIYVGNTCAHVHACIHILISTYTSYIYEIY